MTSLIRPAISLALAAVLAAYIGWPATAAIVVAAYVLLLLVHPVHRCPWCRGERVIRPGLSAVKCRRCKGQGRAYRRGAIIAHRLLREHAWPRLRDRLHDRIADPAGSGS